MAGIQSDKVFDADGNVDCRLWWPETPNGKTDRRRLRDDARSARLSTLWRSPLAGLG